ncbi:MAG TPA: 23S rRNA (pseudouridine(1915)-N(3))-methyltransferase RlmH [Saprospiraceae bacterium]|nr:23S rRNA (pseudouridine(1915)-N(3))-methyltransferase RlmH [Saprospiraceae bacterium]
MKIELLCVGKTAIPYLETGISEYAQRVNHFCNFSVQIIPDVKQFKSKEELILKEELAIRKYLKDQQHILILLDENGKNMSSRKFASMMEKFNLEGHKKLVFVIGGAYGISQNLKNEAAHLISLSAMTFSHQLVRLIFMEQIYRAWSIIHHLPYHHD